jgi:predicted small secreted protein
MKRVLAMTLLLAFAGAVLGGCNTTEGFGKDLKKVGEKVEGAAEDTGGTDPR